MYIQLWQFWVALSCPVLAALAGYELTGKESGVLAGFMAYTVFVISLHAARLYSRSDYWASKMAMLKAEEGALHLALTEASRRAATGADDTSALAEAYRTQLTLLQVRKTALRAGYRSDKAAGVLGHFSETKGGLLPDAG